MKKIDKAQSSVEFFILIAAAVFFFLSFSLLIQSNVVSKNVEAINLQVKEVALSVQDEINLALEASDGYRRDFSVPERISNKEYQITITDGLVYLKTDDQKFAIALPAGEVIGNVLKGKNFILKSGGYVYLNTMPGLSPGGESGTLGGGSSGGSSTSFIRGDANSDGVIDLSDSVYIKSYVNSQGPAPTCLKGADVNDDGVVNLNDAQYDDDYLFSGGPAPKSPYPSCGTDPTPDSLSCVSYSFCAGSAGSNPNPTPIPTATPAPTPTPTPTPTPSPSPSGSPH